MDKISTKNMNVQFSEKSFNLFSMFPNRLWSILRTIPLVQFQFFFFNNVRGKKLLTRGKKLLESLILHPQPNTNLLNQTYISEIWRPFWFWTSCNLHLITSFLPPPCEKFFTPLILSIFSKRSYTITFSLPSILNIVFSLGINPIIIYGMKMEYLKISSLDIQKVWISHEKNPSMTNQNIQNLTAGLSPSM